MNIEYKKTHLLLIFIIANNFNKNQNASGEEMG